jgi:hypothetical protein
MEAVPQERAGWATRAVAIAGFAIVLCSLVLPLVSLKVASQDGSEYVSGKLRFNPLGPMASTTDLSQDARDVAPFDVRGLAVRAFWFSPAVSDGLAYMDRVGGPDLTDELAIVQVGLVVSLLGLVCATLCVAAWSFRAGAADHGRLASIVLLVGAALLLFGFIFQIVGIADMASDSGREVESSSNNNFSAEPVPGAAAFLMPIGSLALGAAGVLGLMRAPAGNTTSKWFACAPTEV